MKRIVVDIETVGQDFDLLDETSQEYFLKFADSEEKIEEAKNSLSFYPLTAQVVTIGMLEVESEEGAVYFQTDAEAATKFKEGAVHYIICQDEKEILNHFWTQMNRYDQLISFNGRLFDCPFLMIRSAIQQIRTTKNLMPNRYNSGFHVDLADQLTFYDAMRRKFSLHMWCKAFGIKSSKEDGVTGLQVKDLYKEKKFNEIARYCLRDVQATKELFQYWEKYLKF